MQKDGGNMLLIKRYGAPLLLVAALYSILYVLFGYPTPYFGVGLFAVLSLSYLIRTCDDLCDYNADEAKGRAPIGRGVLIFACCFLGIASFVKKIPMDAKHRTNPNYTRLIACIAK